MGQFFDSLFLLALVFAALVAPLYLGLAGGGKTELAIADKTTRSGLGQNAVMQAGWEKETKDTGNVYASAVEKTKLAYKAALDMQKKAPPGRRHK